MDLSVAIVTRSSARRIEPLLQIWRQAQVELVIAVDAGSTDDTERLCAGYADRLFRIAPLGLVETALPWLNRQCSREWVLRLDDDELPSAGLLRALPELLAAGELTHYLIPRRWILGDGWLCQHPWWPDWSPRLYRNIPSLYQLEDPERPHSRQSVLGAGRFLTTGSLYHYTLDWQTEDEQREKVRRYEQRAPGGSKPEYYFPPPTDERDLRPLDDDPPARAAGVPVVRPPRPACVVERCEIELAKAGGAVGEDLYHAALAVVFAAPRVAAGQRYNILVDVTNRGHLTWPTAGSGTPWVRLSYHWLAPDRTALEREGFRSDLPHPLAPGQTTRLPVEVIAPQQPGRYVLQLDLIAEFLTWFSAHGFSGPEIEVVVEAAGGPGASSTPRWGWRPPPPPPASSRERERELVRLRGELESRRGELERLRVALAERDGEARRGAAAWTDAQQDRQALRAERDRLIGEVTAWRERVQAIEGTRAWRLRQWLVAVKQALRGRRRLPGDRSPRR